MGDADAIGIYALLFNDTQMSCCIENKVVKDVVLFLIIQNLQPFF